MATFSLGGGVTPGAPGVYINERPGNIAFGAVADFSTSYMLVETPESVPVTRFPFNTPIPIDSLASYKALIGGTVPTARIPLLSYNCVNEFFQNAQVGDLRVVRVGTPNIITEIEILPNGKKVNSTSLPSNLEAGDVVYVQLVLNGTRLVAGDGSTGFTTDGEWLGVPVTVPVDYVAGDEANNRKISEAIALAISGAIESNPNVRSSVYVRSFGLVNDLDPLSNSQNAYVVIAGTTFDSPVSVIPQSESPGSAFIFTTSTYEISSANGQQANLVRVPQDYIQCINTAFDGQRDQGYLITPTAYAQFDALGRASVGAAAAALCENNNFKWMAIADPGPFLVTDINKYAGFVPHKPAANLITGLKYLVDNAIYEWTGTSVTYPKLNYQKIVSGGSPKVAIQQSTNSAIAPQERVGALDKATFTVWSPTAVGSYGRLTLDAGNYWPVDVKVQKVVLGGADGTDNPFSAYEGDIYVVAPAYNLEETGDYSLNTIFLAPTLSAATSVLNYVSSLGGSKFVNALPPGAINIPNDDDIFSATLTYGSPTYDFQVTINGQTSDLLENTRNQVFGINTQHLPGTLQDPTKTYNLGLFVRTFNNPSLVTPGQGGVYRATSGEYKDNVIFDCEEHGLTDGTKIFFNAPIVTSAGRFLVNATTSKVQNPYYVKVINDDTFTVSSSLTNFAAGSYIKMPVGDATATTTPVLVYSSLLAGGEGASIAELAEALVIPVIRARKYGFDSSSIFNQACPSSAAPASAAEKNRGVSIRLSKSLSVLGEGTVSPIGETPNAGWLPQLELLDPPAPATALAVLYGNEGSIASVAPNFVTRDANGYATSIDSTEGLLPGSQGYWNLEGEALMFVPPVWVENNGDPATLTWEWEVSSDGGTTWTGTGVLNQVGVITGDDFPISTEDKIRVAWSLTDGGTPVTGETPATVEFISQSDLTLEQYNIAGNGQATVHGSTEGWYVGRVLAYSASTGPNIAGTSPSAVSGRETVVKSYSGSVLNPVGSDSAAIAAKAASFNTYQIAGSTNGTYISIESSFVVGDLDGTTKPKLKNIVTSATAIGTLQAFAVSNWTSTATTPNAWDLAISGIDVAFFGPQNFTCIPSVTQDFSTESYMIPAFPAFVAGTYNASTNTIAGIVTDGFAYNAGLRNGVSNLPTSSSLLQPLLGVALEIPTGGGGTLPSAAGSAVVVPGNYIVVTESNGVYSWAVADDAAGLETYAVPLYGSTTRLSYKNEETPPTNLWRFDAVTATEIIDEALRGTFSNGVPQALFLESGIDTVNRLYQDSQRYFNPMGFIAFYGPYVQNASGQFIPPSPYVTGIALRRYRAEGYQFPPAGIKYQLADAVGAQIAVNSAQQNLLNPDGCNVLRSLPGYPDTAVFVWGGRTRIQPQDAQQRLYQFVNTRVIMNVVYGSLRNAFDSQIFSVVDGFGVVFNQIISVGNSILNQLYTRGALFGRNPSDAFEVICDERINRPENLENGVVNVKVFVVPVPTLERIQIDLIRVAIGQMSRELESQGLGQ